VINSSDEMGGQNSVLAASLAEIKALRVLVDVLNKKIASQAERIDELTPCGICDGDCDAKV